MDRDKLLALADEIQTGPSGDRQKQIANVLRVIAAEPAPTPTRSAASARATESPPAKAPRQSGHGRGRSN